MKLVFLSQLISTVVASCITANMDAIIPLMLNPACPKILERSEFFDIEVITEDTNKFCYSCFDEMDSAFETLLDECSSDILMVQSLTEAKKNIRIVCTEKNDEYCGSYMQLFSNCNLDTKHVECSSACKSSLDFIREYDSCCFQDILNIFTSWNFYDYSDIESIISNCGIDLNSLCPVKTNNAHRNSIYEIFKLFPLYIIKIWSRFT